jgi:hypothetical protein
MTHDRRRALIALLDAYPIEREAYLYDGRRQTHPREEMADRVEELFKPTLFEAIMTASEAYVLRFGGEMDLEGAIGKMREEWKEMHDEIKLVAIEKSLTFLGVPSEPSEAKELLAKEAIDLLVTIGGVLRALNVPIAMTNQAASDTLSKLNGRTDKDYVWDSKSKTVIKRSKLEVQS